MKLLNLIALLLFIAGTTWVLTRSDTSVRHIQKTFYIVISPFITGGAGLESAASNFVKEAEHSKIWETKYNLVKEELDKKRMEVAHLRKLEIENARLNEALKFEKNTPFHVLSAKIIRHQPSTWWQTDTINRGDKHGVTAQLPVLSPEGLVGKVDAPSANTSTVILLTDENCQVSAKVDGTPEVGILSGQRGQTGEDPTLNLRFLSKDADIKPGALVYTTGRGGLFPADILLGTIETYKSGPLSGEALIKPAVDFAALHSVFVKLPNSPELNRSPDKKK